MADPDHELKGGGGGHDLPPSVISSLFTQNRGGEGRALRAPPLDSPLEEFFDISTRRYVAFRCFNTITLRVL